jgi:hypothetical protein
MSYYEDPLAEARAILDEPCLYSHRLRDCPDEKHWTIRQLKSRYIARAYIACIACREPVEISQKKGVPEELYCTWFQCPACKDGFIRGGTKFCPNCARPIRWAR